ncbi:MAG: hypothetical protein AAGA80_00100 [Cyanobacteria bacterium P01_F01_bin.143]
MLNITFNYDFDTEGFFSGSEGSVRRATLEQAGSFYANFITDNLSTIAPDAALNNWSVVFSNTATGNQQSIENLTIPENTIIIYAGGRDLDGSLGEGGPGGFTASGTTDFLNTVRGRGQAGALSVPNTDYSLWGGSITFDTNIVLESNTFEWHNSIDPEGLESDKVDFLSVAIHELGHVFGLVNGEDNSWTSQISGTNFTGTNALAVYRAENDPNATSVPLNNNDFEHWENGTTSFTLDNVPQEPAMTTGGEQLGQRQLLTNLDYAAFEDIGWELDFDELDTPIYRFQSNVTPGTYLFVGEAERQNINQNLSDNFIDEGVAFNAAIAPNDELIPLFRFQSTQLPGTYLFVGEAERNSINADPNLSSSFNEEGIAFYVYGAGADEAAPFSRFQNSSVPGTYLYATGTEAANIRTNLPNFVEEGIAFEAGI